MSRDYRQRQRIATASVDHAAIQINSVGTGHHDGVGFWTRFADAVQEAGYDGPLSIENEDYTLEQRDFFSTSTRFQPIRGRTDGRVEFLVTAKPSSYRGGLRISTGSTCFARRATNV